MNTTATPSYATTRIAAFASPDGNSILEVRSVLRGTRTVYSVNRLNLAGEFIVNLANRTNETAARRKANQVWANDKGL